MESLYQQGGGRGLTRKQWLETIDPVLLGDSCLRGLPGAVLIDDKVVVASSQFSNPATNYLDENTTNNPNANANQYGDYAQIAIGGGIAHAIWTDTRNFFPSAASAAITLP